MTPTLAGRWTTRILLMIVIGLPVTFLYFWFRAGFRLNGIEVEPFLLLLSITMVGLALDPLYIWIQNGRWDRDWPFAFQFVSMWFEFFLTIYLVRFDALPWFETGWLLQGENALAALYHFFWVFIPSFLALLGGIQIFLIRWRFKGAELGRF